VHDGARSAAGGEWLAPPAPPALAAARRARGAVPAPGAGEPLLELRNVDLYRDYRPVLRGLNWRLAPGEHWAVLGANGSGKSTLLCCLYGDLPAALGGEVCRRGHARGRPLSGWRERIGLVTPELQADYFERLTLLELVASGRRASIGLAWPASARERALARAALRRTGLKVDPRRDARDLSYGQRRLALVARALVRRPEALLLDEPLTGLDAPTRARLLRLLDRLAGEGVQLVVAAHHAADLPRAINRVLVLRAGRATVRAPAHRSPVRHG
jgi:molybdate transport system ATP-binding protein